MPARESVREKIKHAPETIQSIAALINEAGLERLVEGYNHLNTMMLVNFQLHRLIEGSIGTCLNPKCGATIDYYPADNSRCDPLKLACSDDCYVNAVRFSAEKEISILQGQIAVLDATTRTNIRLASSSSVRKGDEADQANTQATDSVGNVRLMKRRRLSALIAFVKNCEEIPITSDCQSKTCDEEVPLHIRMRMPEINICPACQEKKKGRK